MIYSSPFARQPNRRASALSFGHRPGLMSKASRGAPLPFSTPRQLLRALCLRPLAGAEEYQARGATDAVFALSDKGEECGSDF